MSKTSPHDPVKELRKCCSRCYSRDITEPFEMDGYSDGVYRTQGLWWICCRTCGRTTKAR